MNVSRLFCPLLLSFSAFVCAETVVVERRDDAPPPPQLGISPPEIVESFSPTKSAAFNKSIVLYNYNSKPKQVTVELIDTNSARTPTAPSKATLSPWTILNPTTFTIPGNGQQTIRLSIRPPANFPKKNHYAVLAITQQVTDPLSKDEDGIVLKFGSSYALPVKLTVQ